MHLNFFPRDGFDAKQNIQRREVYVLNLLDKSVHAEIDIFFRNVEQLGKLKATVDELLEAATEKERQFNAQDRQDSFMDEAAEEAARCD